MHRRLSLVFLILFAFCAQAAVAEEASVVPTAQMPEEHPAAEPAHVEGVLEARQLSLNGLPNLEVGSNVDLWEEKFPENTMFVSCNTASEGCNSGEINANLSRSASTDNRAELLGQMLETRADGTSWLHFGFFEKTSSVASAE